MPSRTISRKQSRTPCHLRMIHYSRRHLREVERLLAFLPDYYPGAGAWLERRLEEAERCPGTCRLGFLDGQLAGITIVTPKSSRRSKLSTIYVDECARGRGLGTALLREVLSGWRDIKIDRGHVTVPACRVPELEPLLLAHGFRKEGLELCRYGPGRDEMIYAWSRTTPSGLPLRSLVLFPTSIS